MSSCYSFETMHFKKGNLNIDAVYVLTMENNNIENLKKQLFENKPSEIIFIQINKGFNNCSKTLCNSKNVDVSYLDISHAYLNAFKHAKNSGYKNILVLEDDAIFSTDFLTLDYLTKINDFIPLLNKNKYILALGLIPWVSLYHSDGFRKSILATGMQANIFPETVYNDILSNCKSINDIDAHINFNYSRYFFYSPLITQTFETTENQTNWGKQHGIIANIMSRIIVWIFWIFGLQRSPEPGTTILYMLNKFICDLGIPLLILLFLFINIKTDILLNK